jgi:hypothetical protein
VVGTTQLEAQVERNPFGATNSMELSGGTLYFPHKCQDIRMEVLIYRKEAVNEQNRIYIYNDQ